MQQISCGHCGYPLAAGAAADEPPVGIPISRAAYLDEEGRQRDRFQLYGHFHDLRCARAFLEGNPRCQRYAGLLREYARSVWGLPHLPPPAMSRMLLEAYGGPLSWPDWRVRGGRAERAWRLTDAAVREGRSMGRHLLDRSHIETAPDYLKVDPAAELNQPGQSNVLDSLVDW